MDLANIPAQASLKKRIQDGLRNGRHPHAVCYTGAVGSSALPIALAVAQTLLCHINNADTPCGACSSCKAMEDIRHPDLHFFFPSVKLNSDEIKKGSIQAVYQQAWRTFIVEHPYGDIVRWRTWLQQHANLASSAQKNLFIGKEEVSRLHVTTSLTPYMSSHRVVLIWAPEQLHHIAANALLKTLEDPQGSCLFLLVSHSPQGILPTLRSRMQFFQVPPCSHKEIATYLHQHHGMAETLAEETATRAAGNIDQAMHIMRNGDDIDHQLLQEWLRGCWLHDATRMITVAETFAGYPRLKQQLFLKESLHFFRNVLLQRANCEVLRVSTSSDNDFVHNFSRTISYEMLFALHLASNSMLNHLEQHAHAKMMFLAQSLSLATHFTALRRTSL